MTILTVIFYLIGYVMSYYIFRDYTKRIYNNWDWSDVIFGFWISLFSWVIVILILLLTGVNWIGRLDFKEPPKWL